MQLEVKINLILHATENKKEILEVLENTFCIEQKNFQVEQVLGHFNNPILIITSVEGLEDYLMKNYQIIGSC